MEIKTSQTEPTHPHADVEAGVSTADLKEVFFGAGVEPPSYDATATKALAEAHLVAPVPQPDNFLSPAELLTVELEEIHHHNAHLQRMADTADARALDLQQQLATLSARVAAMTTINSPDHSTSSAPLSARDFNAGAHPTHHNTNTLHRHHHECTHTGNTPNRRTTNLSNHYTAHNIATSTTPTDARTPTKTPLLAIANGPSRRTDLMAPDTRRYSADQPTPRTTRRQIDLAYASTHTPLKTDTQRFPEESEKVLLKYVTSGNKAIGFNGTISMWPAFEEKLMTFLRGHGITATVQQHYHQCAAFSLLHNQALYNFLLDAVSTTPKVYAIFRRAPSGDGHMAYCYLSERYGIQNPAALMAQLQFFQPIVDEQPHDAALRLELLYDSLQDVDKVFPNWEKITKLLDFLEEFPSKDFGNVHGRIEDRQNTIGIAFAEAISMIGQRQTILDARSAARDVVPRSRPVYQFQQSTQEQPPSDNLSSSTDTTTNDDVESRITEEVNRRVLLAATHRRKPGSDSTTRREPCPQTPGLRLRRVATECRVDNCKTPSRSRLCEECALRLTAGKDKSLPCTLNGETKHAHYAQQPASGSKPAWHGILIRDAAAEAVAMGT